MIGPGQASPEQSRSTRSTVPWPSAVDLAAAARISTDSVYAVIGRGDSSLSGLTSCQEPNVSDPPERVAMSVKPRCTSAR